eukprot:CAMPEP_0195102106 /NCGR_PEP_ID=MMETSP0448-20130528/66027_1 /TAXON_ID=66468 /ORGANISM="Heterocapsa triquestra, Strain CCMP 448" /LENGTH=42 /DNA_ID= /DNA_START= /DNA_END= /DNA_ORIENTATION=
MVRLSAAVAVAAWLATCGAAEHAQGCAADGASCKAPSDNVLL